jgi:hypothetical protein
MLGRVLVALATALLAAALIPALAAADSETFAATFGDQQFTVPPGITSITVDAIGGAGVNAANGVAALGGEAIGTLSVTPGELLEVVVAGSKRPPWCSTPSTRASSPRYSRHRRAA